MADTVTSADGTIIEFDRYGAGPGVVFVGGATQHRAIDPGMTGMATQLAAAGFATAYYDRRGRGGSSDTAPWALEREAEDLAAVAATLDAPLHLYTSSSGATVALAAIAAGLHVRRAVLYEPPFFAGSARGPQIETIERLVAEGRNEDAMRHNLTAVIGIPAEMVDAMAQSPAWSAMVSVAPTIAYDLRAVDAVTTDPDWAARWAGITTELLVLSGDQTFPGMPEAADATAAALPNARRRVLAGQGHGPTPESVVPVLAEFFG